MLATLQPATSMPLLPADLSATIAEHFPRIHRAALVLTGNPWDADDLAQETFLILAREGARFAGRSQLGTWLYGILLNLDRRLRRRAGTNNTSCACCGMPIKRLRVPRRPPKPPWRSPSGATVCGAMSRGCPTVSARCSSCGSVKRCRTTRSPKLWNVRSALSSRACSMGWPHSGNCLDQEGEAAKNIPRFPQEDAHR